MKYKTTLKKIKYCGCCMYYMTDEDKNGNITEFHHDRNKTEGFCVIRDLFYTVKNNDKACDDWVHDC